MRKESRVRFTVGAEKHSSSSFFASGLVVHFFSFSVSSFLSLSLCIYIYFYIFLLSRTLIFSPPLSSVFGRFFYRASFARRSLSVKSLSLGVFKRLNGEENWRERDGSGDDNWSGYVRATIIGRDLKNRGANNVAVGVYLINIDTESQYSIVQSYIANGN